jgi:hypothetical protein
MSQEMVHTVTRIEAAELPPMTKVAHGPSRNALKRRFVVLGVLSFLVGMFSGAMVAVLQYQTQGPQCAPTPCPTWDQPPYTGGPVMVNVSELDDPNDPIDPRELDPEPAVDSAALPVGTFSQVQEPLMKTCVNDAEWGGDVCCDEERFSRFRTCQLKLDEELPECTERFRTSQDCYKRSDKRYALDDHPPRSCYVRCKGYHI